MSRYLSQTVCGDGVQANTVDGSCNDPAAKYTMCPNGAGTLEPLQPLPAGGTPAAAAKACAADRGCVGFVVGGPSSTTLRYGLKGIGAYKGYASYTRIPLPNAATAAAGAGAGDGSTSAQLKADDEAAAAAAAWQMYTGLQTSPAMVPAYSPLQVHFSLGNASLSDSTAWQVVLRAANGTRLATKSGTGAGMATLPALGCAACVASWEVSYPSLRKQSPKQTVFTAPSAWGEADQASPAGYWAKDNATGTGPQFCFLQSSALPSVSAAAGGSSPSSPPKLELVMTRGFK